MDLTNYIKLDTNSDFMVDLFMFSTTQNIKSTIEYGIGMQLPVYLYLAKNSNKLSNVKVAGFYLQKVLNNEVASSSVLFPKLSI